MLIVFRDKAGDQQASCRASLSLCISRDKAGVLSSESLNNNERVCQNLISRDKAGVLLSESQVTYIRPARRRVFFKRKIVASAVKPMVTGSGPLGIAGGTGSCTGKSVKCFRVQGFRVSGLGFRQIIRASPPLTSIDLLL